MAASDTRGRFVWHDLMTSDPKAAQQFYSKVAGWGAEEWAEMKYTMWTANGRHQGGYMQLPAPGIPPHWLAYIAVPDVDTSTEQAKSMGGKVHVAPQDIPTVGRFAVLADPQGAAFAIFTSAREDAKADADPELGEMSWHELMTTDTGAGWKFYQSMFGWDKLAEHDMGPMGVYHLFGRNGREIGGMFVKPPDMPAPPNWLHYIQVDSSERVAGVIKANGGTILNGPMEVPGGTFIAQAMDPQGAAFAIHSRKP